MLGQDYLGRFAATIKEDRPANDLNYMRSGHSGDLDRRFLAVKGACLQQFDLDQFVIFQTLEYILYRPRAHSFLAYLDEGFQVVSDASEVPGLFSCKRMISHLKRLLEVLVKPTFYQKIGK
ncbi:hypothetical protein [Syntrophotalea sp.]|uniref:hypothetical protein n=1 Tax=Syntrophotalea sp. TaxID=2812029 RepID=UPI003D09FB55